MDLTLRDLRKFVQETADLSGDMPVCIGVPTTSYIKDGKEELDCFEEAQADSIVFQPSCDEVEDYVVVSILDVSYLRCLYGKEYEPEVI